MTKFTPEYNCWRRMIDRYTKPTDPGFKYYGGRGIKVCKRWLRYENFLTDVGLRPSMSQDAIAAKYGLSQSTVSTIRSNP